MSFITQVHKNELYDSIIFDQHVNPLADIAGTKVREATTTSRGTVLFALDTEYVAGKAVQSNDSRLHEQNTDVSTDANTFIFNTDHSLGDNTMIVLHSNEIGDYGGAFRYNDTLNYMEYTYTYNGVQEWYRLRGYDEVEVFDLSTRHLILPQTYPTSTADGKEEGSIIWDADSKHPYIYNEDTNIYFPIGNSMVYRTPKTGADAEDVGLTEFKVEHGAFMPDGMNLLVFVNGEQKTSFGTSPDYTILDKFTIKLNSAILPADVIELIVYTDIVWRIRQTGTEAIDNPTNTEFDMVFNIDDYPLSEVMVFVEEKLLSQNLGSPQYSIDANVVTLTAGITDTEEIETVIILKGTPHGGLGSDLTGVVSDTFRIGTLMHEWHQVETLLFGRSQDEDVGLRNNHGVVEWKDYGDVWRPINAAIGIKHIQSYYGTESYDAPINKQFQITGYKLPDDIKQLQVVVNGRMLSYNKGLWDRAAFPLDETTIELTNVASDTDIIDIYMFAVRL